MLEIKITRPDDWHIHLRDGELLNTTVADVARHMGRAIVMPNLNPPVRTCTEALAYRDRIRAHIPAGSGFEPLMTLYLTDNTPVEEVIRAHEEENIHAVKYYPAGATTNSDSGVTDIGNCYAVLEKMAECQLPLLVHGEVTDPEIDIFDREKVFIDRILEPLLKRMPNLKLVLEHITTKEAADFVLASGGNVASTITPQHLLYNRNDLLAGGIRPHLYCLPVLKRNSHQQRLLEVAGSGNPKFFMGTDSAPHLRKTKENHCGCAGCYSAPVAVALYAEIFEQMNALERLEDFTSHFGADFYGLPRNTTSLVLRKRSQQVPHNIDAGADVIVPLRAGQTIPWVVEAL